MKCKTLLLAATGLALSWGSSAMGQTKALETFDKEITGIVETVGNACGPELEKFCSTVNIGQGRMLMCALAHSDQLTLGCSKTLFDSVVALENIAGFVQYSAQACQGDIVKSCADIVPGEGRVAQCLIDKKAELSEPCASAVSQVMAGN